MICINDIHPAPKATPTYRIRDEAKNAAIAVLGPLAIHEFDFVTYQLDDGRWDWDVPAAERPLSAAVIKANGGKKFLAARPQSMASTPMAHIGAAKPVKLPVPPRRMAPQAAGAPDGGAGGEQPPSDEMPPLTLPETAPACNGLDIAKPDGLDLPTFLKREPKPKMVGIGELSVDKDGMGTLTIGGETLGPARGFPANETFVVTQDSKPAPAKSGTYDELKSTGALRSEPVAKSVGKPPVSRKTAKAKTAPKGAKRASKAPAERADASGTKTKCSIVGQMILRKTGCTAAEAMTAVGWTKISMPEQARKNGITLTTKKDGSVTRYFGAGQ